MTSLFSSNSGGAEAAALEQARLAREAADRALKKETAAADAAAAAAAGAGLEPARKSAEALIRKRLESSGYGAFLFQPSGAPTTRQTFGG